MINKALMNSSDLHKRFYQQILILAIITIISGAVFSWLAGELARSRAQGELEFRSNQVLALHKETIFGLLDKYRLMTVMVARRPDTAQMFLKQSDSSGDSALTSPNTPTEVDPTEVDPIEVDPTKVAQDLQSFSGLLAAMSGADIVSLALPGGKIIAQSSLAPLNGLFLNEQLRIAAIQERLGRATIFSQNEANTYAFAASVRAAEEIVGLVNVEVGLQELENAWALSNDLIFVTDDKGRYIVGNQLASLLPDDYVQSWENQPQTLNVKYSNFSNTYLVRGENYPHIGWTLNVFLNDGPVRQARTNAVIITILLVLIASTLVFILLQRRRAIMLRLETEQQSATVLEKTVAERTAQLRGTNKKLRIEFEERVAAEAALKKAQDSLIQSAKLAAIGQMSTALAHEYNQPLAAIRSYADNARAFLIRDNLVDADQNLDRITKMTERMAQLSKTLKTFARKPRTKSQAVAVAPLLEEAVLLVSPTAKKQKVNITLSPVETSISVMAGQVRLSQVVVNLLSNAIDAVADCSRREVLISAQVRDKKVYICVEDSGLGVPPEDSSKIFDAFFTSKDVGDGLGLGLSIAYNIVHDFGGEILVEQSQMGGAAFTISLPAQIKS
ncbi:MAG: ATP-binding protein [Devosiaceae bacterium]|nr:ATP-binding protein [Devosiaceae bacterium]